MAFYKQREEDGLIVWNCPRCMKELDNSEVEMEFAFKLCGRCQRDCPVCEKISKMGELKYHGTTAGSQVDIYTEVDGKKYNVLYLSKEREVWECDECNMIILEKVEE